MSKISRLGAKACLVALGVVLIDISMSTTLAVQAAETSTATTPNVSGTWQTVVPVVLTSYKPSSPDPTTGTFSGVGSTLWQGTWTGLTHYKISGTANLITGAGSGTIQETFTGRSSDGRIGTMSFAETYSLDTTGQLSIQATITNATGELAGEHGVVAFTGKELGAIVGNGTYSGHWSRPRE